MPKLSFRPKDGIFIFFFIIGLVSHLAGIDAFSAPPDPEPWAENLNLSPDQAQSLKELRSRFRQELMQVRKRIMLYRLELRTLTPEETKGERGEELRRLTQSLLLKMRERSLFYQQEALKILTPEQREKLPPEADLGFHWGKMFHRGGPGMGRGMGPGGKGFGHGPQGPLDSD